MHQKKVSGMLWPFICWMNFMIVKHKSIVRGHQVELFINRAHAQMTFATFATFMIMHHSCDTHNRFWSFKGRWLLHCLWSLSRDKDDYVCVHLSIVNDGGLHACQVELSWFALQRCDPVHPRGFSGHGAQDKRWCPCGGPNVRSKAPWKVNLMPPEEAPPPVTETSRKKTAR